jgi:hypothetical protein
MARPTKKPSFPEYSEPSQSGPTAEFLTLAGIAAAGTLGVGVSEKIYRFLKTADPLVVQVVKSFLADQLHVVELTASNQTIHGIYLESIALKKGLGDLEAVLLREGVSRLGFEASREQWVAYKPKDMRPQYIAPGESIDLVVRLPERTDKRKGAVTLIIMCSRLDQDSVETFEAKAKLRWSMLGAA